MKSKSEKQKIERKKRLARILRHPSNKICADCPETRPTWISFIKPQQTFALGSKVMASFVCLECAGLHRKMGTHICVVRSISHDQFEEKDVDCAEHSGNDVVNEIFEGHLQKSTMDGINIKPLLGAEVARRERFIRQKYVDLYFYRKRVHYKHIAEVNKMLSNSRKASKVSGSKQSPTKPFRKKLNAYLQDDNSVASEKDAKMSGCSTTVGNTTMTPSSTSRNRSLSDQDNSNKSNTPNSRDKKSLKNRSSKNGRKSKSRKKGKKKSSSPRRSKSKGPVSSMLGIASNDGVATKIGETSEPLTQPNIRKDLDLKSPSNTETGRHNIKDSDDLSGMILVFDEESCGSLESVGRERRKSSRDLNRVRRRSTIGSPGSKKSAIDSSNNMHDHVKEYNKKPLVKSLSDSFESREPLSASLRDVRRSKSHITIDEIIKKRDGSISPGLVGNHIVSQNANAGPNLGIDKKSNDRHSHAEKARVSQNKNSSTRRLDVKLPPQGQTSQLKEHLAKDANRLQITSSRKLMIPYLEPSPTSIISVEGFISEESSYGFGDHTVNNMSGTGENNQESNIIEDNSTVNGFRVIDSETISDRSNSDKGVAWEPRGSFSLPFKKKKKSSIKNKSGERCNVVGDVESKLSRRDKIVASMNKSDGCIEYNKSNRSLGSTSNLSAFKKSYMSISNKSNRSIISNVSNTSISISDPFPRHSNNQVRDPCQSPPLKKKRSSKKRSKGKSKKSPSKKSSKGAKNPSLRNQALFDEWERLKNENERKFVEFDNNFSTFHESFEEII